MHPRGSVAAAAGPAVVLLTVAALLLVGGCSLRGHDRPASSRTGRPTPTAGGETPQWHDPPAAPMTRFERQVAAELTSRLAASGLHVAYLDCPPWRGHVPARMSCRGYVDGLDPVVFVRLSGMAGRGVRLDAWLADELVATRNLEATVRRLGWDSADCGSAAAYPATVGSRIICRVTRGHRTSFVVATVRSRSGDVAVAAYGGGR